MKCRICQLEEAERESNLCEDCALLVEEGTLLGYSEEKISDLREAARDRRENE